MSKIVLINNPGDPILKDIVGFLGPLLTKHSDLSDKVLALLVGSRLLVPENLWKKKPDYDLALRMTTEEFENSTLRAFCRNISTNYNIGCPVYQVELHFEGNSNSIDLQIIDPKDWEKKCIVEKLMKLLYRYVLAVRLEDGVPTKFEQRKWYNLVRRFVDNHDNCDYCSVYNTIMDISYKNMMPMS